MYTSLDPSMPITMSDMPHAIIVFAERMNKFWLSFSFHPDTHFQLHETPPFFFTFSRRGEEVIFQWENWNRKSNVVSKPLSEGRDNFPISLLWIIRFLPTEAKPSSARNSELIKALFCSGWLSAFLCFIQNIDTVWILQGRIRWSTEGQYHRPLSLCK